MTVKYLKIGHDCSMSHPSQFILQSSSIRIEMIWLILTLLWQNKNDYAY